MPKEERALETKAAPETVWKIWSDASGWPAWNPDVKAMTLDGPFVAGATGAMTTRAGTHKIRIAALEPGRSFRLDTSPVPLTQFAFECEVVPLGAGSSWISQAITMRGPLAPLFSRLMSKRIADGFVPLLRGLADAAERSEQVP